MCVCVCVCGQRDGTLFQEETMRSYLSALVPLIRNDICIEQPRCSCILYYLYIGDIKLSDLTCIDLLNTSTDTDPVTRIHTSIHAHAQTHMLAHTSSPLPPHTYLIRISGAQLLRQCHRLNIKPHKALHS